MILTATTHVLSRLEAPLMSSASQLLNKIDSAAWPVARPKQSVGLCLASASPCIQTDVNKFRTHGHTSDVTISVFPILWYWLLNTIILPRTIISRF